MSFFRTVLAAAVSAIAATGAAHAATFNFSYDFDGMSRIAGTFDGDVTDGILSVDSTRATIFEAGEAPTVIDSTLGGFFISGIDDGDAGRVSLDGSFFDLAVIAAPSTNICANAVSFCLISNLDLASFNGASDDQRFTLAGARFEIAPVPVPASLPLIALGAAALGAMSRRRKAAV